MFRLPLVLRWFVRWSFPGLLLGVWLGISHAHSLTQTFDLQPGWNAVWLEVDPPDRDPAVVFAQLPLHSVWTFSERLSATDFIQSPETSGWNRALWLGYFPPDSPEARLANLFAILPQRAYLLRLAGTNAVRWSLSGRPTWVTPGWVPDRFNLRGFPVDPALPPTFQQFFRSSPAHFEPRSATLQTIYRLNADGQWTKASGGDRMRRGEAYWVYTKGASDFVAPFQLSLNSGETINFDRSDRRVDLTLQNRHSLAKSVQLTPLTDDGSSLLLLPTHPALSTNGPRSLAGQVQTVPAGSSVRLRLGLDRTRLPSSAGTDPATGRHATLWSVSDGEGTLFQVGVEAELGDPLDYTGLWLGTVTVTNVSSVLPSTNAAPAPGPVAVGFPLRLLLHVDSAGQASLLREVTLVYTQTNSVAVTNGASVLGIRQLTQLVTDPAWLIRYSAADLQNGLVSGRRITAPHFDFAVTNGQFALPLQGVFAAGNSVSGTLNLPSNLPTNPFLHRYHPDHSTNAYALTRALTVTLGSDATPTSGSVNAVLTGVFQETITGLHKLPLFTSGSVQLQRLSTLGQLNAATP